MRGVAVGEFAPMNFSFSGKARLLTSFEFWVGLVAFCVLILGVALVLACPGRGLPALYLGDTQESTRWLR